MEYQMKIGRENEKMNKRLQKISSAFNVGNWEKNKKTQERFVKNIRRFTTDQFSEERQPWKASNLKDYIISFFHNLIKILIRRILILRIKYKPF